MSPRLAARLFVDALRRCAEAAGGEATVLARGDATSGALLLVHVDRDGREQTHELGPAFLGGGWSAVGPGDGGGEAVAAYLGRRRRSDPDLWVVEVRGGPSVLQAVVSLDRG